MGGKTHWFFKLEICFFFVFYGFFWFLGLSVESQKNSLKTLGRHRQTLKGV